MRIRLGLSPRWISSSRYAHSKASCITSRPSPSDTPFCIRADHFDMRSCDTERFEGADTHPTGLGKWLDEGDDACASCQIGFADSQLGACENDRSLYG